MSTADFQFLRSCEIDCDDQTVISEREKEVVRGQGDEREKKEKRERVRPSSSVSCTVLAP